jgi:hypothetical protein
MRITVGELLERAVKQRDARAAAFVADYLRAKGWRYDDIYQYVNDRHPISLPDWESLMYESETLAEGE